MTHPPTHQARSAYRAILRELPRKRLSTPTPLHQRLRAVFRSEEHPPSTTDPDSAPSTPSSSIATSSTAEPLPFSTPSSNEDRAIRIQEAEQFARYARAQRMYATLLGRYNPGMNLDEQERIRLTARRVGLDLPELHSDTAEGKSEGGDGEGRS